MAPILKLMMTATKMQSGMNGWVVRYLVAALVVGGGVVAMRVEAADHVTPAASIESTGPNGHVFCNGIRLQDEIVVVNTRRLCGSTHDESIQNRLEIETYAIHDETGHRGWMRSDLENFLAFDPSVPTVIFIHGNQITEGDAKHEGLTVYRRMMDYGSDADRIRFVIFSSIEAFFKRDVRILFLRLSLVVAFITVVILTVTFLREVLLIGLLGLGVLLIADNLGEVRRRLR